MQPGHHTGWDSYTKWCEVYFGIHTRVIPWCWWVEHPQQVDISIFLLEIHHLNALISSEFPFLLCQFITHWSLGLYITHTSSCYIIPLVTLVFSWQLLALRITLPFTTFLTSFSCFSIKDRSPSLIDDRFCLKEDVKWLTCYTFMFFLFEISFWNLAMEHSPFCS